MIRKFLSLKIADVQFAAEMISVVEMDHRFLSRYTCPHCRSEVLLTDEPRDA
jgi:hypothetical protein